MSRLSLGNVFDGQQDHRFPIIRLSDAPGIEQHLPAPELWKIVFDLEILKKSILRKNLFQQLPELGKVPLTIAKLVNEPILRFLAL